MATPHARMGERGISLVEVIVAMTILATGVVGVVTTSAAVNRMMGRGALATTIGVIGESRLERLMAQRCGAPSGGDTTIGRLVVEWSVTPATTGRDIRVKVTSPTLQGPRIDTFTTRVTCIP